MKIDHGGRGAAERLASRIPKTQVDRRDCDDTVVPAPMMVEQQGASEQQDASEAAPPPTSVPPCRPTAKQVSLWQSKRHEKPFAEQRATYELRNTLLRNGRPTRLCRAYSGNRLSSRLTGMVRWSDAWKKFHAKAVAIPCAGRLCLQGRPSRTSQERRTTPQRKQQTTRAAHHTTERERERKKESDIKRRP